jgi:hypothetical protein
LQVTLYTALIRDPEQEDVALKNGSKTEEVL